MQVENLIRKYLAQRSVMQIATVDSDLPWICTVNYVEDEQANVYWLSFPSRRHSQDIAKHPKVAIAIPIKFDMPVIGLQAEGEARAVHDHNVVAEIMPRYIERHNKGHDFYDNFAAGTNQHVLYRFTPHMFGLFDEVTFNDGLRREWRPSGLPPRGQSNV